MVSTEHSGLALSRIRSRLLVTLQGDLSPEVHERLRTELLEAVRRHRIRTLIVDLSAVQLMDLSDVNMLQQTAQMAGLMGARTCLIGLSAGIISFLACADVELSGVTTAGALEDVEQLLRADRHSNPQAA